MAQALQFLRIHDVPGNKVSFVLGESFNKAHPNEIELVGWNWDVSDPAVPTGTSKPKVEENSKSKPKAKSDSQGDTAPRPSQFTFTKTLDRSTPRLLNAMNSGEAFPEAFLYIEDSYEKSPYPFSLTIKFDKLVVMKLSLGGNAETAGVSFTESWTVTYKDIKFSYKLRPNDLGLIGKIIERIDNPVVNKSKKLLEDPKGTIDSEFRMPPDADQILSNRVPPTAREKAETEQERMEEFSKKNDFLKSADLDNLLNAWAKKKGLIK
jgi:type VI protein secretion system component Hcp